MRPGNSRSVQHYPIDAPHLRPCRKIIRMKAIASENPYDKVPYPNWTHRDTHPRQLEFVATLFGMQPTRINNCRVLEIGCAAGWNLLPMAHDLPNSSFVGIDLAATQITEARKLASEAGIDNIRFEQADILNVDATWGQFDYIVCHGIYSWVPENVREKILAICKNNLTENGVALVSYNVYPGWHFRGMIRDMMRFHVSGQDDPDAQTTQARAMLDFVATNAPQDSAYTSILKTELAEIENEPDAQLFHEHLERINQPVYFHEFAAQSQAAGLQYLGDAQFSRMLTRSLSRNAQDALSGLPIVRQEQYMDFLRNRAFRRTLLCHQDVALDRNLHADDMRDFEFGMAVALRADQIDLGSDDPVRFKIGETRLSSTEPIVKAAVKHLTGRWPDAMTFRSLHAAASKSLLAPDQPRSPSSGTDPLAQSEHILASSLLAFLGAGLVHAWVHPPEALSPLREKPVASMLTRAQARRGNLVSNRRHQQLKLNDTERHLIGLLDGEHDRTALVKDLRTAFGNGTMVIKAAGGNLTQANDERLSTIVDQALAHLHDGALLMS